MHCPDCESKDIEQLRTTRTEFDGASIEGKPYNVIQRTWCKCRDCTRRFISISHLQELPRQKRKRADR